MKITEKNIIYKKIGMYAAFPSIIKGSKVGEYFVSFRLAPESASGYSHLHSLSTSCVARVYKNKITEIKKIGENDPLAKQDTQLFRVDDKTIIASYFRYSFHPLDEKPLLEKNTFIEYKNTIALLNGIGISVSIDNGKTFDLSNIVTIDGEIHFAIRGSMCKIKDKIFMPVYAYKRNKKYQCFVASSKDFISWRKEALLCETEYKTENKNKKKIEYVEPSLCFLNNVIFAFIRTHINDEYAYTSLSVSYDIGKTFTKPVRLNINGYPLHPLILRNGKLLMTYGYRLSDYGVRARLVDLSNINTIEKIVEKINEAKELIIEDKFLSADCGYPWTLEDDDGSIVCVYYGHKKSNTRFIALTRFEL